MFPKFLFPFLHYLLFLLIFLFLPLAEQGKAATALSDGLHVKPCPDLI